MSLWQIIFLRSKVNHARYEGDRLLTSNWNWPKETWFQLRLRDLRRVTRQASEGSTRQRWAATTRKRISGLENSAESYFGVGMPSRSDIRTSSARELAAIFSIT
jgi:hypothetical protein